MSKTSVTSTTSAPGATMQFTAPAIGLKVHPIKSFDLNIGEKPIQIKASEDVTINIFPRKGNLLFVCESKGKKFTITIHPKSKPSDTSCANTDRRGQAVIKGNFEGEYVLEIRERKV